jgi:hypothetical protein
MDFERELWRFIRLANAVCKQCGDDNPYLDNDDPNFLCRQCRTRQEAWGGDNKKKEEPKTLSKGPGYKALKAMIDETSDQIEAFLASRKYCSRLHNTLRQWQHGTKEGYIGFYMDYIITGGDADIAFREVVDRLLVYNLEWGTPVNDRVEADGRCVAYWNIDGDIDDEADYGKAVRIRLLTQPRAGQMDEIRFVALIPATGPGAPVKNDFRP